jgi:DNA-binding transcriptional LysR family regulator
MVDHTKTQYAPRQGVLTFSSVRIFEAVARHNNFSRAADELGVSQPYVSNQIAELEQKLDLILFRRIGRRVYVTDAGNRLYAHAKSLLSQLAVAEESMAALRSKVLGRLECASGVIPAHTFCRASSSSYQKRIRAFKSYCTSVGRAKWNHRL